MQRYFVCVLQTDDVVVSCKWFPCMQECNRGTTAHCLMDTMVLRRLTQDSDFYNSFHSVNFETLCIMFNEIFVFQFGEYIFKYSSSVSIDP